MPPALFAPKSTGVLPPGISPPSLIDKTAKDRPRDSFVRRPISQRGHPNGVHVSGPNSPEAATLASRCTNMERIRKT